MNLLFTLLMLSVVCNFLLSLKVVKVGNLKKVGLLKFEDGKVLLEFMDAESIRLLDNKNGGDLFIK